MTLPMLAATIERVTLVRPDDGLLSRPGWIALIAFVLICLVLGGAISRYAWRDRRLTTPEEKAFRRLARAMGLSRSDTATLRMLARTSGLAEVALTMNPGAFNRAAASANPQALQDLRRRLFSDRSS